MHTTFVLSQYDIVIGLLLEELRIICSLCLMYGNCVLIYVYY